MDFNISEEQCMIQQTARDFARDKIEPLAARLDENREFPVDLVRELGELGFMGVTVNPKWGGAGMDPICYALAVEEISRACASTGVIMSAHNSLVCDPLEAYGTDEQKEKYLTPLASGKKLGAHGLTEPSAGSDVGGLKTRAVLDGDEWVLNGSKIFITNGAYADIILVFASTDPEQKARGISAFIVEKEMPGFKVGSREKTMGIRASCTSELIFEDLRIPKKNMLGELNRGFKIAMVTLNGGRIGIAAQAVGIARSALEKAIEYSKNRQQFNQPISNFQAIQWMLADMATETDAARLLTLRAAYLKMHGKSYATEAAQAKLFASRTAMRVADRAIQIHGGYGFSTEYHVERHLRDAKITELYEGTSEIQRIVIARSLLAD
ncbi:MAG: acyl-CoA dehydrogenase [Candidatus Eisenbacteria bacterium]|uniref:Acyl-CoA dehydrogenase n=1 Tax=Eiseniibacteriota bacterium TaxID=2212470 RepID=A0A948RYD5_UNCEI|nr:acyl-CoA dehydrogenase [Candidatus Eisenbacteria bacterium]MBU1947116.1 acyl-CoA dehydrogenase [Candidatus Eisenbacteria bacterium]MBU2691362.1 acyl-CoA dehydrogenase [Candidatus Eisenbacteria bacterium]